jgi:hypothetical protein
LDALQARFRGEIGRPFPGGEGHVNGRLLRRDRHHLAAPPGHRPDIAVDDVIGPQDLHGGRVDLFAAIGQAISQQVRRLEQAVVMLIHLEDVPTIGALALEDAARVVQAVAQHVQLGVAPRRQFAVEPDDSVTVVEWQYRHSLIRPNFAAGPAVPASR